MKTYTLEEVQNTLIGEIGTPERNLFEHNLQTELDALQGNYTILDTQILLTKLDNQTEI